MALSPLCQVQNGSGSFLSTAGGVNVTGGQTMTVRLTDPTDAVEWYLVVLGTDETTTTPVPSGVNTVTNKVTAGPTALVTFPMPTGTGRAVLLESTVTGPGGPLVTTFALFVPTAIGGRVGAAGEQREGNATYGWASKLNPILRLGGGALRYDDTQALPALGVGTVQQAIDALKSVSGGFMAGGDLSGSSTSQSVVKLRGYSLPETTPQTGDLLTFGLFGWTYAPPSGGGGFTAAGDLSGDGTSQQVTGLQGRPVLNNAPYDSNAVLGWNGFGWTPRQVFSFSPGQDLDGSNTEQTLIAIQGIPLYANSPNTNDTLVFDGTAWQTAPGAGGATGTASGDLGGTYPSPSVLKLRGKALHSTVGAPTQGDLLYYSSVDAAYKAGQPSFSGDVQGTMLTTQVGRWMGKQLSSGYTSPANGQMPVYQPYTTAWGLTPTPSASGSFLYWNTFASPNAWALSPSPSTGQSPVWNGSLWTMDRTDASKLQGYSVDTTPPTDQALLTWDATNSRWTAQALSFLAAKTALGLATSPIAFGNQQLTGVADPTTPQGVATKAYVDGVAQGLDAKASVRVATTANITLSGVQVIDGITLVAGDRVLVKNQTNAADNGIWIVAAGAWSRSSDADSSPKVTSGLFTFVEVGTINADSGWVLITDGTIVLGTTALSFTQFSGAGQITAGNGLTKSGNTLSVLPADASITVSSSGVSLGTVSFSKVIAGLGTAAPVASGQIMVSTSTSAFGLIAAPSSSNTFLSWNGSSFAWATPTFTESQLRTAAAGLTLPLNVNAKEVTNAGDPTAAQSLVTRVYHEKAFQKVVVLDSSGQSGTWVPPSGTWDSSQVIITGSPTGDQVVQVDYYAGRRWTVTNAYINASYLVQLTGVVAQRAITLLPGQTRDIYFDQAGAIHAADEKTLILEIGVGAGGAAGTYDQVLCKLPPRALIRSCIVAGVVDRSAGAATTTFEVETSAGAADILKNATFPGSGVIVGEASGDWGSAMAANGSTYSAAARILTYRNIIAAGTVTGSPSGNLTLVAVLL